MSARKRETIKWRVIGKKANKKKFVCFFSGRIKPADPLNWSDDAFIAFAVEIENLSNQRIYSRTELDEKFALFGSEQHLVWSYYSWWTKMYNNEGVKIHSLVKSEAFSRLVKTFPMEAILTLDVYKNKFDMDGLKCELKSVDATDFSK